MSSEAKTLESVKAILRPMAWYHMLSGDTQIQIEQEIARLIRDAARVPEGCVRTADVSVLQEIQNAMDERCIGEGYCCFCGEEYMTTGLRGDMEDVGYCWICATEKLEVIGPMLPAIIAALAQPTPARGEGE